MTANKNSNYTVLEDPAVDARIQKDLDYIVGELVALLGESIRTILLCGGFGRGEGGVYFENGRPRPLNDYDLTVVVYHSRAVCQKYGKQLSELAQRWAEHVGIKQIDLAVLSAWQLAVPRNSVVRHEMKFGHKVLYGTVDFPMVSVRAERIPLDEGTRYFFTRSGGLLIARLILDLWEELPEGERERNFIIEMNKACMAMGDSRLIREHLYCCSYQTRLERIDPLRDGSPETGWIIDGYQKAVRDKLEPDFSEADPTQFEAWWKEVSQAYLQEFLDFERLRLKNSFVSLPDYADTVIQWRVNTVQKLRRTLQAFVLRRPESTDEDQMRSISMLLLAGREDPACLMKANEFLQIPLSASWRESVVKYLGLWHPEGIIKAWFDSQESLCEGEEGR